MFAKGDLLTIAYEKVIGTLNSKEPVAVVQPGDVCLVLGGLNVRGFVFHRLYVVSVDGRAFVGVITSWDGWRRHHSSG